ncbi:MAG: integrase [Alphaproteobacteria bacterium]|nr:MAG: integrase [Alphaproteobacteria bacterium]
MSKVKSTYALLNKAKPKASRYLLRDTLVPGLCCRIFPSGCKSFIVEYINECRQQKRLTIGKVGAIPLEEARAIAQEWLVQVSKGIDPLKVKEETRQRPTVAEFAERYLREHAEVKKKPRSIDSDRSNLRNHVIPNLGKIRLDLITRQDIQRLHSRMHKTPGAANHVLCLLSKMLNLAEKWGERPDNSNPCRHIEKYPGKVMERFLSHKEFAQLAKVLNEVEQKRLCHPNIINIIRLLIFTGCRVGEIIALTWSEVDMENSRLLLADSKTGRKTIHLSTAATDILALIERSETSPYVFPGRYGRGHMNRIGHQWLKLRKRAGLDDVRLHDLRHSFASIAVGQGTSLPIIGKLLGHSQPQTTARYAHLDASPVGEATNRISRYEPSFLASDARTGS